MKAVVKSRLDHGYVRKKAPCPFTKQCIMTDCSCYGKNGVKRKTNFSCGMARAFDLMTNKELKEY